MCRLLIFLPVAFLLYYLLLNLPHEFRYLEDRWIAGIVTGALIFLVIPGTIYLSLSKIKKQAAVALAIGSWPLLGISFGILTNNREINDLNAEGQWTKAVVVNKKKAGKRAIEDWEVASRFVVNGQQITVGWDPDYEGTLERGDSVDIIYHPEFPELHRIKAEWEKSN
ncbi:MAG: hypothetical protein RLO17_18030 [Cyclobacteriaceae bacterium]